MHATTWRLIACRVGCAKVVGATSSVIVIVVVVIFMSGIRVCIERRCTDQSLTVDRTGRVALCTARWSIWREALLRRRQLKKLVK